MTIHTDGSTKQGTNSGGAGIVITTGHPESPTFVEEFHHPVGKWTSSCQAEMIAMKTALCYLCYHATEEATVRIVTDSKSTQNRLRELRITVKPRDVVEYDIQQAMVDLGERRVIIVMITWCPSHCGLIGNEAAYMVAADDDQTDIASLAVSFDQKRN